MITAEALERVRGWFTGRLPEEWRAAPPEITVDRDEITVVLHLSDVDLPGDASEAERSEARAGRAKAFREETRRKRMSIADEAQHRFERKVSRGVVLGEGDDAHRELFTHVAAPGMTRLRQPQRIVLDPLVAGGAARPPGRFPQPQRIVLDTLVAGGVARSRADALAWCVRLVGEHEDDWLAELRDAMTAVADVRAQGPAA